MFFRRMLLAPLGGPTSRNKVRLLLGPRQAGKTELLRQVLDDRSAALYDLAAAAVRRRFEIDPGAFTREAGALPARVRAVVVDEIQKVPALLDEVQGLYDRARTRFQFFLTGSSARKLRQHSANLLPGRAHVYRLYPVCRWESAGPEPFPWPGSTPSRALNRAGPLAPFPDQTLERTLLLGNLPGVRTEPRTTAAATLAGYVDIYLEEEIRREALVRDLGSFSVFLRLAAIESGRQVNLARLSQESGISASTLKNYYDVLQDTFTGHWLRAYGRSGRKRLLTTPRFLLFDTGVRNAAAGLPLDRSILAVEGPGLLEQWVGLELLCRAAYLGPGHELTFWRTATGAEVDFVWQSPREDVPIEVKWTAHPRSNDARHVEAFLDEYPGRARSGLVVCQVAAPERLSDRVVAIPWNRL